MAHALLDAAAGWLKARGRTSMMGPIDYSVNYPCGLLVDGFDWPPRIMTNHNRPYYAGLLESWGLAKAKDFYCWWFVDPHNMVDDGTSGPSGCSERGKIVIRPFRTNDFVADSGTLQGSFQPLDAATTGASSRSARPSSAISEATWRSWPRPELVLLAEVDGRPVGFSITLPDINEAIRPLNGRLTNFGLPINLFRLLAACAASRRPA